MTKKAILFAIFLANLAGIFYIWWSGSGTMLTTGATDGVLIALGRLCGLLAAYSILLQLVLIGRITFIEQVFGHDRMNKLHRTIGYSVGVFFLLHPILLTIGYAKTANISLISQFLIFLTKWDDILKAFLGLLILIAVIIVSLPATRRRIKYESWYFTHICMYVAIFLIFDHQTKAGDFISQNYIRYWYILNFTVFGLVLLYRFLRPLYRFYIHRFFVERVVQETHDVFSIYISGRTIDTFKFEPGQFSNLTFLANGHWFTPLQKTSPSVASQSFLEKVKTVQEYLSTFFVTGFTHPFSFSQAPNAKTIRYSIKQSGDFTNQINKIKPGTKVIIDGPLGIFTEKHSKRNKYLFIAGGIGITPIRAMIELLAKEKADMVLLCANKTEEDIAFRNELDHLPVKVINVLSQTGEPKVGFEYGFIDQEKIKRLVPDFQEREIYLCGPPPMMLAVRKNLAELGFPETHVHYERFSY